MYPEQNQNPYGQQPFGQQPFGQQPFGQQSFDTPQCCFQRQVGFGEAISRAFSNYCNFSGRASRSEFWWFYLFGVLINLVVSILTLAIGEAGTILSFIVSIGLLLPTLGLIWRRLHDIGKAGGWYFILLVPCVGIILLLIWWCKDSEPMPNRFGDVPNVEC